MLSNRTYLNYDSKDVVLDKQFTMSTTLDHRANIRSATGRCHLLGSFILLSSFLSLGMEEYWRLKSFICNKDRTKDKFDVKYLIS